MVKAIAFDLARVFIKIKDIKLPKVEEELSLTFDYKVGEELFWDWARNLSGLEEKENKEISRKIINILYEIREPDIFEKLPPLKFATASNHISLIKDWLKEKGVYDRFYCHVISEDIHFQKPSKEFYEVLINKLGEKPEDILFVDDRLTNVEGAKNLGLRTLHYDENLSLSGSILKEIK